MASLALRVIERNRPHHLIVDIMTSRTLDAHLGRIIAFAIGHTIRLETHVRNVVRTIGRDLLPRAMALAAELRDLLRLPIPHFHRSYLRCTRAGEPGLMRVRIHMATRALDAGRERFRLQNASRHGTGRMAIEAFRSSFGG